MTPEVHHLCVPVDHALILVLDGAALGPGGILVLLGLVTLRCVVYALLCVEALPEGVLCGLPVVHNHNVRCRVISMVELDLCVIFLCIRRGLEKHVARLVQVITLRW